MKKYIVLAIFLAISSARAQEAKTYHFDLTTQEIGTIAEALGSQPYRNVAPLIAKLDGQLKGQAEKPADKPAQAPSETAPVQHQ